MIVVPHAVLKKVPTQKIPFQLSQQRLAQIALDVDVSTNLFWKNFFPKSIKNLDSWILFSNFRALRFYKQVI
jgi:hypothetical protein